jgi:hypothetical protein
MIGHENVGIELDAVRFNALLKFIQERDPIRIAREDLAPVHSP